MAKLFRNKKGIGYLKLNFWELMEYSKNGFPICDECSKDLIGYSDIILIPILNEAFCNECGKERLKTIVDYPEDKGIRIKREEFYKDYWGLAEVQ